MLMSSLSALAGWTMWSDPCTLHWIPSSWMPGNHTWCSKSRVKKKKEYIDATWKHSEISQKCRLLLRATALLLSVSHLVLVTRNACHMSGSMDWIDQSLHAAEDHMVVLREAALASEPERSMPGADAQREQAI